MERKFLDRAVEIALKVDPHKVTPNPRVGCVIVHDGKIMAEGSHEVFGQGHAEVNAMKNLPNGIKIEECDVYVTLEPCGKYSGKKTPSCAGMLVAEKPRAVYVGMLDPKWNGAELELLRENGILAEYVAHEGCEKINPFFVHWSTKKKPYVTVKLAMSLDGKITNPNGRWVSGEVSRRRVHEMRAEYSAVLTTPQTIEIDDPFLTTRLEGFFRGYSDPKVVIAGKGGVSEKSHIFQADREVVFYKEHDITGLMDFCVKNKIDSIFTECGSRMCTALLQAGVVDEVVLFIPSTIYGSGLSAFGTEIDLGGFMLGAVEKLGNDVCVTLRKR